MAARSRNGQATPPRTGELCATMRTICAATRRPTRASAPDSSATRVRPCSIVRRTRTVPRAEFAPRAWPRARTATTTRESAQARAFATTSARRARSRSRWARRVRTAAVPLVPRGAAWKACALIRSRHSAASVDLLGCVREGCPMAGALNRFGAALPSRVSRGRVRRAGVQSGREAFRPRCTRRRTFREPCARAPAWQATAN